MLLILWVVSFSAFTLDICSTDPRAKALCHVCLPRRRSKCWSQYLSSGGKNEPGNAVLLFQLMGNTTLPIGLSWARLLHSIRRDGEWCLYTFCKFLLTQTRPSQLLCSCTCKVKCHLQFVRVTMGIVKAILRRDSELLFMTDVSDSINLWKAKFFFWGTCLHTSASKIKHLDIISL